MTGYILPPLRPNPNVPEIQRGAWLNDADGGLLQQIADSIQSSQDALTYQTITAIPDTWAQVDLFRTAMQYGDPGAISQWRGMLALLALRAHRELPVTVRGIDLQQCQNDPYNNGTPDPGNFAEIMAELHPSSVLQAGMDWNQLASLRIGGRNGSASHLIGLVVPSILVCPAANPLTANIANFTEAKADIAKIVPWYDDKTGQFFDPCKSAQLCPGEIAALYKFLDQLAQTIFGPQYTNIPLKAGTFVDTTLVNSLQRLLNEYKGDCTTRYQQLNGRDIPLPQREFYSWGGTLALPQHAVYNSLAQCWDSTWNATSDVLLPGRAKLKSLGLQGAILCDSIVVGNNNTNTVQVWEQHCLTKVLQNPNLAVTLAQTVARAGYLWITSINIFTPNLIELENGTVANHGSKLGGFLLPFTPLALLLWSPAELLQNLRIDQDGDTRVVRFIAQIQDRTGKNRPIDLRREYTKEQIKRKRLPTTLSQWPLVPSLLWPGPHFIFYGGDPQLQVALAFPLSIAAIAAQMQDTVPAPSVWASLATVLNDAQKQIKMPNTPGVGEQMLLEQRANTKRTLSRTPQAPEALVCGNGLILLPTVTQTNFHNGEWHVAIDFGTSNTMVYYLAANGVPSPLPFAALASRVLRTNSVDIVDEATISEHREFIPLRTINPPFMTILRARGVSGIEQPAPLWSDHIYYINQVGSALNDIFAPGTRPLRFGFKWSVDPTDRRLVRLFISQVAMHILAEAATHGVQPVDVKWHFSYPEAYQGADLREFQLLTSLAIKLALNAAQNPANANPTIKFEQESLATAKYFAHTLAERQTLGVFAGSVITIDIGGGSSDITVWHQGDLLWRTSLRLAGQHILTEYLCRHWQALLKPLAQDTAPAFRTLLQDIETKTTGVAHKTLKSALEILINSAEYDQAMRVGYPTIAGTTGAPLARLAKFALAGILYYVGLALRTVFSEHFIQHKQYSSLTLCLGGRGSRLYESLFGPDAQHIQDNIGPIAYLLSDACGGPEFSTKVIFSHSPKSEVAYGLLVSDTLPNGLVLKTQNTKVLLPTGEEIKIDGDILPADITTNELDLRDSWQVANLSTLDAFLLACQQRLRLKINISPELRQNLITTANQALEITRQSLAAIAAQADAPLDGQIGINAQNVQDIEPVFIIVLRALIESIVAGQMQITSLDAAPDASVLKNTTNIPDYQLPWERTMLAQYRGLFTTPKPDIQAFFRYYKVRGIKKVYSDDLDKAKLSWIEEKNIPLENITLWAIPMLGTHVGRYYILPGIRLRERLSEFLADNASLALEAFQGLMDIVSQAQLEIIQPVIVDVRDDRIIIARLGKLGLPIETSIVVEQFHGAVPEV